jgi:hypothetical protein
MSIPPFEREIEIRDFDYFLRSRLSQAIILWPEHAIALVGYMGWPSDPEGRAASAAVLQAWPEGSRAIPPRLRQIQTDWARVADIFNIHLDLTEGGHQKRRGGPSIGKASPGPSVTLRAAPSDQHHLATVIRSPGPRLQIP